MDIIVITKAILNTLVRLTPIGLYTGAAMNVLVMNDFRGLILFMGFFFNELISLGYRMFIKGAYNPHCALLMTNQGTHLPKDADEHIAQLRSALTGNTECGNTHYNLAVALMGKQEYVEAEHELHEAVDCSPSLAEAYVLLGGICLQRKDLEGCYNFNNRAVKARAGFAEGYGDCSKQY